MPRRLIQGPHRRFPAPARHGALDLLIIPFQPGGGLGDDIEHFLKDDLLDREGHFDFGQIPQVGGRPTGLAAVTQVVAQQIHFELLPGPMLLPANLETGADQIPHGLILRFGHINGGQFPGPIQAGQVVGIPPVGLDPLAGFARHFRGTDQNAVPAVRPQTAAEGKAAGSGLVTELQARSGMGGLKFMGQFEHVVMLATDDPVTAHFGRIGRREAHRDRVVMHVQSDEKAGTVDGRLRSAQENAGGHRGGGFEAR